MVTSGQPPAPRRLPLLAAGLTLLVLGAVPSAGWFPARWSGRPGGARPVDAALHTGSRGNFTARRRRTGLPGTSSACSLCGVRPGCRDRDRLHRR